MDTSNTPIPKHVAHIKKRAVTLGLALIATLLGSALVMAMLFSAQLSAATIGLSDGSLLQGELTSAANGDCVITRANGTAITLRCAEITSFQTQAGQPSAESALGAGATFRLAGSNTIGARLMPALLLEFARSRGMPEGRLKPEGPEELLIEFNSPGPLPWRRIRVSAHGTSTGFKALGMAGLEPANAGSSSAASSAVAPAAKETEQASVPDGVEERILNAAPSVAGLLRDIDSVQANPGADTAPIPQAEQPAKLMNAPARSGAGAGADLAMASRRILAAEVQSLRSLGQLDHPDNEHVIALDSIAVIVNRANRIEQLSIDEISKIYAGLVNDWSELGGAAGPIQRYARTEGSGTMDTFSSLVLHGARLAPAVSRIEDSRELAAAVARNPGAIGFVGVSYVGASKALGISECGLSYQPTSFNTKTEEYPLSRRLYLYAPARRTAAVQEFLQFTATPTAQRVVDANGFVGLSVETDSVGDQRRLRLPIDSEPSRRRDEATYSQLLRTATRLSVTLRFRTAAADLDTRALKDIDRIHAFIKEAAGRPRRLTLVGFSDSIGSVEANKALSLSRAQSVAAMLRGLPVARVIGIGPEFPVACNSSDEGRSKNRRVEIWIDG